MTSENRPKNILVAPLNWGLGHASRCIPIIRELLAHGFTPILASDGQALDLLNKEFPELLSFELPSYKIEYPRDGRDFKIKMLKNTPRMLNAIRAEKKLVRKWVTEFDLCGIISDNRPGVRSKKVASVYITHQLNVLTGNTTWISSKIHRYIIGKFTECWVPDFKDRPNLSGKLGHLQKHRAEIRYIGPLSRFSKVDLPPKYALAIVLSGPEPQRTMLENKLKNEVLHFNKPVVFVRGIVEKDQTISRFENVTYFNFMTSQQLQTTLNESEIILARSGYSTIMDLAALGKKCFLIPTPGQFEQQYLAEDLAAKGFAPFSAQSEFKIGLLAETAHFSGIPNIKTDFQWRNLFGLFERK